MSSGHPPSPGAAGSVSKLEWDAEEPKVLGFGRLCAHLLSDLVHHFAVIHGVGGKVDWSRDEYSPLEVQGAR